MSSGQQQYYLDSSAIVKLYRTEVGSHKIIEIFENDQNIILFPEISYTETISVLNRMKSRGDISKDLFQIAIQQFRQDFIDSPNENILPVSLADVVHNSYEYILSAYKLKDEIDKSLPYIQSLDALHLGSWINCLEKGLTPKFITADKDLAKIASAYKDHFGYEVEVINLGACGCLECAKLKQEAHKSA